MVYLWLLYMEAYNNRYMWNYQSRLAKWKKYMYYCLSIYIGFDSITTSGVHRISPLSQKGAIFRFWLEMSTDLFLKYQQDVFEVVAGISLYILNSNTVSVFSKFSNSPIIKYCKVIIIMFSSLFHFILY